MYHQFEEGRLMSGYIKQEISDPSYEDAEEDETMSSSRDKDRSKDEIQVSSRTGRDGATNEKMLSGQDERLSSREGRIIGQDGRMDESSQVKGIDEQKGDQGEDGFKNDVGELSQRISALSQDEFRLVFILMIFKNVDSQIIPHIPDLRKYNSRFKIFFLFKSF